MTKVASAKTEKYPVVAPGALANGYRLAVRNAQRLLEASSSLIEEYPSVSLGLSQLGQEEVGKSLSLLAVIGLKPVPDAWRWFWRQWKDHRLKAHRAYLYELLNPQRIEIHEPGGRVYDGGPLRDQITAEKEAAFYVDFDFKTGLFVLPQESVTATEAHSRLATLAYLGLKAAVLHDVLFAEDPKFRLSVFSGIAFRMCTEEIFQQDMPGILEQFAEGSARHRALVEDLHRGFAVNKIRHSPSAASTSAEAERERN